jgi:hypothetical protein
MKISCMCTFKSQDKLAELSEEKLFHKGFVQNVAQMLLSFDDPNM